MTGPRFLSLAAPVLVAAGLFLLGDQVYMRAKAWLATRLIERAFAAHLADGRTHRPWKWADFHPLARIDVERLGVRRFVLSNATGSALAFGLGRVDGTTALAGHRDTWAAFFRELEAGDTVRITARDGVRVYRVAEAKVVDRHEVDVLESGTDDARLTLITCYPFSGLTRSSWRYIVRCELDSARHAPNAASIRTRVASRERTSLACGTVAAASQCRGLSVLR